MLASALNLPSAGTPLSAPPGKRILFGAQSSLRHTLPQDRSTITFSTQKDLINHWIVVQRLTLDRDWTWSGLAQNGAGQIAFTFVGATYSASLGTPTADRSLLSARSTCPCRLHPSPPSRAATRTSATPPN